MLTARASVRQSVGSSLAGTSSLAVNGGALIINVITGGLTGFVFWIVAARAVDPSVISQATTMVTTMLSVVTLSQTSLAVNVPMLVASARRPRRLAGVSYLAAMVLTAIGALLYVTIAPQLASGLHFLRDPRLFIVFVLGCLIWSPFSLQDSVMTGLRWGKVVLLENSVWGIARLAAIVILPLLGVRLGIGWLVAAWLVPASLLVAAVTYALFIRTESPLHGPLGDHTFDKRQLVSFLGIEQASAVTFGVMSIAVPALALTALGARGAAPFMAAYAFIVVAEGAMASFSSAFAVELRRNEGASRNLVAMTAVLLGTFCLAAIVLAHLYADDFMGLFGASYRVPGGAVLTILVWGLPARCLWMISSAANRVHGRGWSNFTQNIGYALALIAGFAFTDPHTGRMLALCLIGARYVAAAIAVRDLRHIRTPVER